MQTTIYTLDIDNNYAPELTKITRPLLEYFADRIEANLHVITERKYPDWPPVYEKMQIFDLAKQFDSDWNFYLDSDALIHPDMPNFLEFLPFNTVAHNGNDPATSRWTFDEYFRRDARNISSCNWCTIASRWCVDLWHPLDISFEEALSRIKPIVCELDTIITPEHLIDDYTLSRNIARFGLKFTTVQYLMKQMGYGDNCYFFHQYTITVPEKLAKFKEILPKWKVPVNILDPSLYQEPVKEPQSV